MNNKTLEVKYCKKCGCELASDSKHKKCDNCRSKTAIAVRKGLGAVGTVGGIALTVIKWVPKILKKK